jgi:TolB-like protein
LESGAFEIETIPRVGYRLVESRHQPIRTRRWSARWLYVATASILLMIVAALLLRSRTADQPTGPSIAVVPFEALNSDPDAKLSANSVSGAIADALVETGARVTPTDGSIRTAQDAQRAGAGLVVTGSIRRENGLIKVSAQIVRPAPATTLISKDIEIPVSESASVPDRVAASIADTIDSWSWILRHERDPDRIATLIAAQAGWSTDSVRAYHLARDLARSAPGSGNVQWAMATHAVNALPDLPQDERPEALGAARAAARRARALLPTDGDVYVLDCQLNPPGAWVLTAQCEDQLRRGMAVDGDAYFLPFFYADELVEAGRYDSAERISKQALAAAPFNPDRMAQRLQILSMMPEAHLDVSDLQRRLARYWPRSPRAAYLHYQTLLWSGQLNQAEAVLDHPEGTASLEVDNHGPAHLIFRALRSRKAADVQAARASCEPKPPRWLPADPAFGTCLVGLATLGDLETAFKLALNGYSDVLCCSRADAESKFISGGGPQYPRDYILGPSMAKFRADRRFIQIAVQTGLLAYWKTGRPPDFCMFERAPVCAILRSK